MAVIVVVVTLVAGGALVLAEIVAVAWYLLLVERPVVEEDDVLPRVDVGQVEGTVAVQHVAPDGPPTPAADVEPAVRERALRRVRRGAAEQPGEVAVGPHVHQHHGADVGLVLNPVIVSPLAAVAVVAAVFPARPA